MRNLVRGLRKEFESSRMRGKEGEAGTHQDGQSKNPSDSREEEQGCTLTLQTHMYIDAHATTYRKMNPSYR
jgi:hypothetical protein